jgi:hypothetical protein
MNKLWRYLYLHQYKDRHLHDNSNLTRSNVSYSSAHVFAGVEGICAGLT